MSTALKKNKIYLTKINKCPLCDSKKIKKKIPNYSNRYSEQLSNHLKVKEKDLLDKLINFKCKNCGLIYKSYWFKNKILKDLYSKIIPYHPKGWDTNSNKFSIIFFSKCIEKFLKKKNNITQRTIEGILDAIETNTKNDNLMIEKFKIFIKKYNKKNILKYRRNISNLINTPKEFSRFKNFNNLDLFNYIQKKNRNIKTYSEIGCPMWGMYNLALKKNFNLLHFEPNHSEFWGKKCIKYGISCLEKCKKNFKIKVRKKIDNHVDYLGIYLYLDHIKKLKFFFNQVFNITNSVGIILEDTRRNTKESNLAVQHFTSWDKESINFLSKKYSCNYYTDFNKIKKTGNIFFYIEKK
jgi:hypothetical protein